MRIRSVEQTQGSFRYPLCFVQGSLRKSRLLGFRCRPPQLRGENSDNITSVCSKTDLETSGAVVAVTSAAVQALDAILLTDFAVISEWSGCGGHRSPAG